MERNTPVRKPHTSTADLLTWSETPPSDPPILGSASSRSNNRPNQPSGVSKVVFGGQVTEEEAESLNKRKPCSDYKLREITGSGIFVGNTENDAAEPGSANGGSNNRTGLQMYQQTLSGINNISFGEEESISPKKPTTIPKVAKQRELSGTLETKYDLMLKKQISDAKSRELSGQNIFAPPEIVARPLPSSPTLNDMVDTSTAKKIHDKKFAELSGNNIFKEDGGSTVSAEKSLSSAKLREISGNDIFADGKAENRDYFGGVRKPPGGESSIALV